MSKILITGNGFDLFHHLPTKYHHFISIMETIEKFQFKSEVSFTDLFGRVFKERFSNDFELIVDNYNVEQVKFDNSKIKQIDELLKINLWYKYFKTVLEIETWIDFEMEVEIVLNEVSILLKSGVEISKDNVRFIKQPINYENFILFGLVECKNNILIIPEKYIDKRKQKIKNDQMLVDLAKSFEEFIKIFNRYLVDVVSVFYTERKQKSLIPFHLINEIYTFNYTPTIEKFYNVNKSKVVYLHGEMNEDCQKQNLVLGVGEINDEIKKSKIYGFTKYYQKIKKRTNTKFVNLPHSKNNLEETIFYIIGHSLDASDKEYIFDLFEFLKLDTNKFSKICVFYFNEEDYNQKLNNLFSIIDKSTIVNFDKEGRLYFKILSDENITEQFGKRLTGRRQTGPVWS